MFRVTIVRDDVRPSIRSIINALTTGRRQLLSSMGKEFQRQTLSLFDGNKTYQEKTWPKLSNSYAKKEGSSNPTLNRTGKLKQSIKVSPPHGSSIDIYTRNAYAEAIAFGNKNKNLPPRNFWPINNVGGNPYTHRLVPAAERDLFRVITRQLNLLSRGQLPYQTIPLTRMTFDNGNPFVL